MDICELHGDCGVRSIENGRTVITINGIKFFKDNIIGRGSNGTVVYEGERVSCYVNGECRYFSPAAVKCLSKEQFDIQIEGIRYFYKNRSLPHINRFYEIVKDKDFVFIATDLCDYDLHRLVKDDGLYAGLLKENGYPTSRLLQLIKNIVSGIKKLHSLRIIHGELKPSHVLISEDRAVLSVMGRSKRMDEGKSSLEPNATSKHPFGDLPDRDINVANNNIVNLFMVEHIPEVKDLVSRLLEFEPELRLKESQVEKHPLFWNSVERLRFLSNVSSRLNYGCDDIVEALQSKCDVVFSKTEFEDDPLIAQMKKHKSFNFRFGKVQSLLRVINILNTKCDETKLPTKIKELLGSLPQGFDDYLSCKFPNLLMVVYQVDR